VRVKLTTKSEVRDSLEGIAYRISDEIRFNIIPRKLRLTLKGEYNKQLDNEYDDDLGKREETETRFWSFGGRVKYSITPKLSVTAMGRYEDSEDETVGSTENYDLKVGGLNVTYLF
jgi:maltoporin